MSRVTNKNPSYKGHPVGSESALCDDLRVAGVSPRRLRHLADTADSYYREAKRIPKEDGSVRIVYDVRESLKSVQTAIHRWVFGRVQFPIYQSGGIKGRSTRNHARPHIGARVLITEDLQSFFPSIKRPQVVDIFHHLFKFPPEIAELFARLTTFRGIVPQGAPTSTDIANLVLFRHEPLLVTELEQRGFSYTRFVDDMGISAASRPSREEIAFAIDRIHAMARRSDFTVNRSKHKLSGQNQPMVTTGRLVNRRDSLPRAYEMEVWKAVLNAENLLKSGASKDVVVKAANSALGKINHLSSGRPTRTKRYHTRTEKIYRQLKV